LDAIHDTIFDTPAVTRSALGFMLATSTLSVGGTPRVYYAVRVPHWAILAAGGLMFVMLARAPLRRRRWRKQGRCSACGYDLRESPARCPECGNVPGAKASAGGEGKRRMRVSKRQAAAGAVVAVLVGGGLFALRATLPTPGAHRPASEMIVHAYGVGGLAPPADWPPADAPAYRPRPAFDNSAQAARPPGALDIRAAMLQTLADAAIDLAPVPAAPQSTSVLKSGYAKPDVEAQPWSDDHVVVTATGAVHRRFRDLLVTLRAPVGAPLLTIVAGDSAPKPRDVQDVEERLSRVLDEVRFDDTPLDQAIEWIRDQTHANISVDWRSLEGVGIDKSTPIRLHLWDVRASKVLSEVLELAGSDAALIGYRVEDGVARVRSRDELSKLTVLRIYDVRTLLKNVVASRRRLRDELDSPPPPAAPAATTTGPAAFLGAVSPVSPPTGDPYSDTAEELLNLVREQVDPDSWRENGGSIGTLREWAGRLLIQHTPEGHRDIEALLKQLDDVYREPAATESSSRPVAAKP
jgi:hypothetical protein